MPVPSHGGLSLGRWPGPSSFAAGGVGRGRPPAAGALTRRRSRRPLPTRAARFSAGRHAARGEEGPRWLGTDLKARPAERAGLRRGAGRRSWTAGHFGSQVRGGATRLAWVRAKVPDGFERKRQDEMGNAPSSAPRTCARRPHATCLRGSTRLVRRVASAVPRPSAILRARFVSRRFVRCHFNDSVRTFTARKKPSILFLGKRAFRACIS